MPTISPARTSSETSRTDGGRVTAVARTTTSVSGRGGSVIARPERPARSARPSSPTICPISSSLLVSATVALKTRWPLRSTVARSQCAITSSRKCVTSRNETPSAASALTTANSCSISSGLSAEVGSSSTIRRPPDPSARAISTICWVPIGSCSSRRPGSIASRTVASRSRACARTCRQETRPPRATSVPITFSATVSAGNSASSW